MSVVHVHPGVPTHSRTGQRRSVCVDGELQPFVWHPEPCPSIRGGHFTPGTAASVGLRREFWSVQPDYFELSLLHEVHPGPDWRQRDQSAQPFEVTATYASMLRYMLHTFVTPACQHATGPRALVDEEEPRLGPDAAVLMGWRVGEEFADSFPERVLVALTKGMPMLRWNAAKEGCWGRKTVMMSADCCISCAISFLSSQKGKWFLVL